MAFNPKLLPAAPGMQDHIRRCLTDSASDFLHVVWPAVCGLDMIGGGELLPVEASADKYLKDQFDLLAGIDAWQVQADPSAMRGLASRVQWGTAWRTYTIRTRSKGGGETELEKRARAIAHRDEGHLYPHLTVQAYLDRTGGSLLCAAVVRTVDLIGVASFLRQNMKYNSDKYGYIDNTDGSQFMYLHWDYLAYKQCKLDIVG